METSATVLASIAGTTIRTTSAIRAPQPCVAGMRMLLLCAVDVIGGRIFARIGSALPACDAAGPRH
jgi:hypothetical protein